MADTRRDEAARILQALADLAPSGEAASTRLRIPTEWFRWLDVGAVGLCAPGPAFEQPPGSPIEAVRRMTDVEQLPVRTAAVDRAFGERLAAVDQVRPEQRSLRVGWLFVAGRTAAEDGRARVGCSTPWSPSQCEWIGDPGSAVLVSCRPVTWS